MYGIWYDVVIMLLVFFEIRFIVW